MSENNRYNIKHIKLRSGNVSSLTIYIIEAVYNWIEDSNFTPFILIDSEKNCTGIESSYIGYDSKTLLNISSQSVKNIKFYEKRIKFITTFDGQEAQVIVPINAILELYSYENKQGLFSHKHGYIINIL